MKTTSRSFPHHPVYTAGCGGEPIEKRSQPTGIAQVLDQVYAFGWIVFALIVGTIIFELNVIGAELPFGDLERSAAIERESVLAQIERREQDFAITHAGIDGLLRVERDSKLRQVFDAVIANVEAEIAQREKIIATKQGKAHQESEALAAQEAKELGQMVQQAVHSVKGRIPPIWTADHRNPFARVVVPKEKSARPRNKRTSESPTVATVKVEEASSLTNPSAQGPDRASDPQIIRVPAKPVVVPPLRNNITEKPSQVASGLQ